MREQALYRQTPMRLWALIAVCLAVVCSALPAVAGSEKVPRVLSERDIERYREIIALQSEAKWKAADALINRLDNDILTGHVLFQRYMHPTGWRSRYSELRSWMAKHSDQPGAWRVYRLALKRRGRARYPKRPEETRYPGVTGQSANAPLPVPKRSRLERRAVDRFKANVRRYVRRGQPERAEKRYWAMEARGLLAPHEAANALERIAASYYYNANDRKALALGGHAVALSGITEPGANWIAGLAAWRQGKMEQAYHHFSAIHASPRTGQWLESAGDVWAARTAHQIGRHIDAHAHLIRAAQSSETFYGLIANRMLGQQITIDWRPPELTDKKLKTLLRHPAVPRAIALTEIGRDDLADEELRLLWGREGTAVQDNLLALASALNLPAIQLRLGRAGGTGKAVPAAVRYPTPDWAPVDGLRLDRAMLYAMIRQESDFRTRGKSGAGARGLMQVMPATASFITRDRSLFRRNKNRLYEPEFNMALGQQYVEMLLNADYADGNLFMVLAAYNGGPGSLVGWKRDVAYNTDPLLFIESIGFYETRHYIERVMTNLWLYRMQLGQETPSLDAIASGAWPALEFLDTPDVQAIEARRAARLSARTTNFYPEK